MNVLLNIDQVLSPWLENSQLGGLEHLDYFSIYWEESSQLTNIFSEGLKPPTRQANDIRYRPFVRKKMMLLAASTIEEVGCCFLLVTVSNKTPQSDLQAMFGMLK